MPRLGLNMQRGRSRILDLMYLVSAAVLVCILGIGAFLLADFCHVNPAWVFVSLICVLLFAGAREDYRKQFRSRRFVAFLGGWVVINVGVFIVFLSLFGWLWLIPALLLEQLIFYMTAHWFFGVAPPSRRWPFQRVKSSDQAGPGDS
jgi:uncharacterized membrane protein YqgA involved in biofilm formation